MVCSICNKEINLFTKFKIKDDYICSHCYHQIPSFIRNDISNYDNIKLISFMNYFDSNKEKKFDKTASYGLLEIDEINGYFKIKDNQNEYIFNCLDMEGGYILCVNPRANKYNKAICDVELFYKSISPRIEYKIKLKKNVICQSKVKGNGIEWTEPSDLTVFRNMFNQMLKKARENYAKIIEDTLITKDDINYLKAKSLFMVEDNYTLEDIKNTKKKLMKVFHPDETGGDEIKSKIINEYYNILKEKIGE